jgi:di/tricarboxylate transporter
VAFLAPVAALILGVLPADQAFAGFGHPATAIVALVLIISGGLSKLGRDRADHAPRQRCGAQRLTARRSHGGVAARLSSLMNNGAALALLVPVDIEAAKKAKRSPALTLMPLSFAMLLGGLIGTPPNIVIPAFREETLAAPFRMFDFTPVGAACAIVGRSSSQVQHWSPRTQRLGRTRSTCFGGPPSTCSILARGGELNRRNR